MSTLVANCPTKCPPVDHIDWQRGLGIIKANGFGSTGGLITTKNIGGLANEDWVIPKNFICIGFQYNRFVVIAGTNRIFQPLNGSLVSVNFDKKSVNAPIDLESIYCKMQAGTAEEVQMASLLLNSFCTKDFNVAQHTVRFYNNNAFEIRGCPVILDTTYWQPLV